MNKLYRVLVLLVLFGLGIQCASAANVTSFDPQTVKMDMRSLQNNSTVQLVMDKVPDGLSGFNITVSVSDPKIAEITAVSLPGWSSIKQNSTSPVPSSSVWIKSVDLDDQIKPGDTNVSLGNITITGKKAGTADLNISKGSYYDPDGGNFTDHIYLDLNSISGKINVLDKISPVANFTANKTEGIVPLTVQFNDTSTNSPTEWNWNFGDETNSTEQNPEHTFSKVGVYNVTLVATNGDGSSDMKSMNITVNPVPTIPVANFTASLTVQFTDISTNNPNKWNWDFGDGTNSTEQNPVHVYSSEGTYYVTLVARNDGGSGDVRSMVITVNRVLMPAVSNFTANTTEGIIPLTVQFTDTSTNNPNKWNWDFGDGTNSTTQSPEHTFSEAGVYNVTLVATNSDGSSGVKSMNITANRVLTVPVANFTANTTEGTTPLTVQFTDISTNNPTGWNWNFGDGTNSTEQNPMHTYSIAGNYTVNLTATNGEGPSSVKSMNITVNRVSTSPVANFTSKQTGSLTIQFNDTSSNSPNGWNWEFGDGSTSTDANPAHVYAAAGNYVVNLTASNADGTNATSKTITVTSTTSASPKASFTAVPRFGRAPLTVKFTDQSVDATSVKWTFGDGATSTATNPSHTYKTRGFYTVKLTAMNGDKSSVASKVIYAAS
ncbi:MAG: PKD domain-containing protein [Lachnospiraceae bacterium]|nr:PKD domain-containing protein [Lachnospiraceae bacterium]